MTTPPRLPACHLGPGCWPHGGTPDPSPCPLYPSGKSCGAVVVLQWSKASCLHPVALPSLWADHSRAAWEAVWPLMSPPQRICLALTFHLEKGVKDNSVQKVVMRASGASPKAILGYAEDQVVACHLTRSAYSSTFHIGAGVGHTTLPRMQMIDGSSYSWASWSPGSLRTNSPGP